MKIKSLFLGSVTAAGMSAGAFAADLGVVLTSLDVCDNLGLAGLTISSDTNCLQITGGVSYEFTWGDYEGDSAYVIGMKGGGNGVTGGSGATVMEGPSYGAFTIPQSGAHGGDAHQNMDWASKVKAWIQFVATADSDFGPARAVIKLQQKQYSIVKNEGGPRNSFAHGSFTGGNTNSLLGTGSSTGGVVIDEAYVSIGDSTILLAGKKSSILDFGQDEPLNFLGLFYSDKVDKGVKWTKDHIKDGGHVIQLVSDLGNGVSVGVGLENLNGAAIATGQDTGVQAATAANVQKAGTAVGVVSYAGDGIAAHVSVAAGGVLDGTVENWGVHAGFAGTFDVVNLVAAIAADDTGYWNALASASATFDIVTLAVSGEAVRDVANSVNDYGFGASAGAAVTDGVSVNVGGRWYHDASANVDSWQAAVQLVAAVTENVTLTGEVGAYGRNETPAVSDGADTMYGAATVAWAPGGNFTSSLKGEVYGNGGYKATFKAAKTFE